jgi:eukaryotic-like serine/threonine-protein kinase
VDAHSVGVAHRDIKPNNIVVDETGRAFLIDFGLCTIVDDQLVSMTSQDKYGNEAFAAPECLHGSPLECGTEASLSPSPVCISSGFSSFIR